ncbi:MAG: tetrathionate reductase family octaheme c-type cytochrome [Burkholderiales bacterium]|nr:tetrathionate reductase family octaheme c-type cytochrome [Burkholderiales bacterium]
MRTAIVMAAIMAVTLLSPAAPAAADSGSAKLMKSTSDHTKFKALQRQFGSGPEVTKACLSCHTEAAKQLHKTEHWKWEYRSPEGQLLGKKTVINNFCTTPVTNEAACNTCHIGYGWKDDTFDFTSEVNVDCLVCHDTTGNYRKQPGMAGNVVATPMEFPPGSGVMLKPINLEKIAQAVGKTSRDTCGACHFYGGGGDGVKHGDMDSSLAAPDTALDVHMDALGLNFTCATCHMTKGHQVPGSRYAPTAQDKGEARLRGKEYKTNPTTCQACHGQAPHKKIAKLNDHTDKVACQTCHVPEFARGGIPTKMAWDWSTAGKMWPEGKPLIKKDAKGHVIYAAAKGNFALGENVVPDYLWFNGRVTYTLRSDKVDKDREPVQINHFDGSASDGKSLIWPVKIMRGKQAFDPVNRTLIVPHLAGNDDTAYWTNFNWEKAAATGMAAIGAPFSGKVDFIATESYWPITHMVAPAKDALGCRDCHAANGRLEKVSGVYIPGRTSDHTRWLETAGWALAALTLLGVLIHGLGRVFFSKRKD